ncbi:MAG: Mrp/NBP35 family ATP-binding protein [Clostridiales bacterium]|nr:Mrp/NBP35 family ATP-binding protein [Clostridiales bacterium]
MTDCETCKSKDNCNVVDKENCEVNSLIKPTNEWNHIKKVIPIVSGKGGVGKSLMTALLATLLARKGYKVGILDADITGPSIPKMFGLSQKATGDGKIIYPAITHNGIKVMSINLLLENEEDPVVWRGPIIAGTVTQFWTDVLWGELDFLLIDMPPGTGDVPLTIFQSIPVDGIVVVTSPQELVSMIVKKAYNMADKMNIKVFGAIENMSYAICPNCNTKIELFGSSKTSQICKEINIPHIASMPIDPNIAKLADTGEIEKFNKDYLDKAVILLEK